MAATSRRRNYGEQRRGLSAWGRSRGPRDPTYDEPLRGQLWSGEMWLDWDLRIFALRQVLTLTGDI